MSRKSLSSDYEPVVRSRPAPWWEGEENVADDAGWPPARSLAPPASEGDSVPAATTASSTQPPAAAPPSPLSPPRLSSARRLLKRGHALSYLGLFLFTFVVYFRPYELFPALSSLTSMAYWLAVATCLAFIPSQLSVEGTLTVRPREVNLALLLCLAGLLSVPLA
ncbi:MAG TPA: hypothetical protein VGC64_05395, partial [Pyrinomonadaceae bacterium]